MAEQSAIGWTTDGVGDGINSGYTQAQVQEWMRSLFAGKTGADLSGVCPDYLNMLAVSGTSTPVAVNTGAALVYGIFYSNSASVNVVVPTPSVSTRIDRIVLQANWTAQTVRIARVAGTEGAGAPSITQTAGTTWQMTLAQASITTGGVITVTDQREWLSVVGDGTISTAKMADSAVTTAKIADSNITLAKMADNSVGTAELVDLGVTTAKLAAGVLPPTAYAVYGGGTNGVSADNVLTLSLTHELDPNSIFSISSNVVTIATAGWYMVTHYVNLTPTTASTAWDFLSYVSSSASAGVGVLGGTVYCNGPASTSISASMSFAQIIHIAAATGVRFHCGPSTGTITCNTDHQISFQLLEEG